MSSDGFKLIGKVFSSPGNLQFLLHPKFILFFDTRLPGASSKLIKIYNAFEPSVQRHRRFNENEIRFVSDLTNLFKVNFIN